MDATTLVTIITMFIVTDTSSEFVKYDGLMDCLKEKRKIEKMKDGRRVICGPSLAEVDANGKIVSIKSINHLANYHSWVIRIIRK